MLHVLKFINDNILWGIPFILLLFGTHLFFTFKLGIQKYIFKGIKLTFIKDKNSGDISPWESLATALGATMGTGNIVGVATAVAIGGPGALFWCWLTGVFGIATKYAESVIAIKFRRKTETGMVGGAMTALEYGLNCKWGGVLFAIFTALAGFGIGTSVQANSISTLVNEVSKGSISVWLVGIVLTVVTFVVIVGGIKSVSKVCTWITPFMGILYILTCIIILCITYKQLPGTFRLIISEAFSLRSIEGGLCGFAALTAMRMGVARGLFSNESGMGSAPIVAALSKTSNSVKQSLVSATGTFWDTVVCCLITGLVVINTGAYSLGLKGANITNYAFQTIPFGSVVLSISLFFFTFSTILGWFCYGETAIKYIFGNKAVIIYKLLYVGMVLFGAVASIDIVWALGDMFNALMVLPNLVAMWLLSGVIIKETKKYLYTDQLDEIDGEIQ